ncbi:hypothetical protein Plim_0165 [Planctopirus limnophila DSM 3776]|uniref:Branched-chain amino acid aminotransferase n=3 Tax=Planctopirus TaxID=1649480 RepID=D5SN90_PLAL2|nr:MULTISPECIES: hypothetical protein [Planctopirus]ADG66017.1 hypothetical protein Plim_0165 [Planctopirus limnophila DSM 3776]ODA34781.1 hypothetical protein A6X21_03735 [Planctopirus hydrillae]QDV29059.1 hypothetical protein Spb1_09270 [Planctopirus ephydatiae]
MLKTLYGDENGAIISAELVLVLTVLVLGVIVGLSEVAVAVNTELNDLSNAIGRLDQSYCFTGFKAYSYGKLKSHVSGSSYKDSIDDCDVNGSCELVCGANSVGYSEGN